MVRCYLVSQVYLHRVSDLGGESILWMREIHRCLCSGGLVFHQVRLSPSMDIIRVAPGASPHPPFGLGSVAGFAQNRSAVGGGWLHNGIGKNSKCV